MANYITDIDERISQTSEKIEVAEAQMRVCNDPAKHESTKRFVIYKKGELRLLQQVKNLQGEAVKLRDNRHVEEEKTKRLKLQNELHLEKMRIKAQTARDTADRMVEKSKHDIESAKLRQENLRFSAEQQRLNRESKERQAAGFDRFNKTFVDIAREQLMKEDFDKLVELTRERSS